MVKPLFTGSEWTFDLLNKTYEEIEKIGVKELGLNLYPNQIEIITSEQMLDSYSSNGMPVNYGHWSFGKRFIRDWDSYKKGQSGLAYEIVLNCLNGESKVITPNGIVSLNVLR
jgi:stage V sporulation protein R